MPSKNRVKIYIPDSYYHIYNRGVAKQDIFLDDEDYRVFINLFKRYLGKNPEKDNREREYQHFHNDIKLLSYCLMPNHFHLFVYQKNFSGVTQLLRAVCTSYTGYFNKKYKRVGPLFQGIFKASMILNEGYLLHISRYIHRNPKNYTSYRYSSYKYYIKSPPEWLETNLLLSFFDNDIGSYKKFVEDDGGYEDTLEDITPDLAQK